MSRVWIIAVAVTAMLLPAVPAAAAPDRCADAPTSDFADREEAREVHRPSIDCVDHTDISNGDTRDGQRVYLPGEKVSRGQMASFVIQTLIAAGYSDELEAEYEARGDHFRDVKPSNPHFDNINAGFEQDLFNGTEAPQPGQPRSGRFAPVPEVLRDQMATFLTRLLDLVEV